MLRVVKVGGSLLDWPSLPSALREWLNAMPPASNILLCGCGRLGDAIRQADQCLSLGEERSHWLCIDALSVTARLLAAILPELPLWNNLEQLITRLPTQKPGSIVFDPRDFLREYEATCPGRSLPHTWDVTTDSIAARLTEVLNADELVLLKSAEAPAIASLADLAASGFVDRHFPFAAANLRSVRLTNLRGVAMPSPGPRPS